MHYQRIENALKTLATLFSLSLVFPNRVTFLIHYFSFCWLFLNRIRIQQHEHVGFGLFVPSLVARQLISSWEYWEWGSLPCAFSAARWGIDFCRSERPSIGGNVNNFLVERDSLPSDNQLLKKGNVKPVNMNKNSSFGSHYTRKSKRTVVG